MKFVDFGIVIMSFKEFGVNELIWIYLTLILWKKKIFKFKPKMVIGALEFLILEEGIWVPCSIIWWKWKSTSILTWNLLTRMKWILWWMINCEIQSQVPLKHVTLSHLPHRLLGNYFLFTLDYESMLIHHSPCLPNWPNSSNFQTTN